MTLTTAYTLRVATYRGHKVATLESLIAALTKMADDYESDGEHGIAEAFRLFAQSLVSEALAQR